MNQVSGLGSIINVRDANRYRRRMTTLVAASGRNPEADQH